MHSLSRYYPEYNSSCQSVEDFSLPESANEMYQRTCDAIWHKVMQSEIFFSRLQKDVLKRDIDSCTVKLCIGLRCRIEVLAVSLVLASTASLD